MRLALDTNRFRDLVDGVPEAIELVNNAERVIIPFAVIAELHAGFRHGTRRAQNEKVLSAFLEEPETHVLYADSTTVDAWATLDAYLLDHGKRLPHNDVWIAALCVQHGLRLYTRDSHFDHLPQVLRV